MQYIAITKLCDTLILCFQLNDIETILHNNFFFILIALISRALKMLAIYYHINVFIDFSIIIIIIIITKKNLNIIDFH